MSLITRCPTCETMFRVVPDQLRVSEGWVRCGQCAEIFDATQHMVTSPEAPAPAPAPAPSVAPQPIHETRPQAAAPAPAPVPAQVPPPSSQPSFIRPAADSQFPATDAPGIPTARTPEPAPPAPQPDPVADEPDWADAPLTDPETVFLDRDSEAEPSTQPLTQAQDTARIDLPLSEPAPAAEPPVKAVVRPSTSPPRPPPAEDVPPVSFLRQAADAPSFWSRPVMRWTLLLVLLALLVLLVFQIVLKERNRIAALEPATRPVLQALCGMAGCSLSPLRQIESIVIDSSTFSRIRGDDYRLGFALRNTAPIAIAMPAIELSLTDPQDQAVIRRVIQPAEFAAGTLSLAKSSVWTGSLSMSVRPSANTDRIAGYRLLAFYP
jgi:predicted Zn finger-like uncharacterized protein